MAAAVNGQAAAADPAQTTQQQTAPPPSPTTPAALPTGEAFYQAIEDEGLRALAAQRKFDNFGKVLKSYQELETLKGAPPERQALLPVVAPDAKADDYFKAMEPVFDKLGRPADAKSYELKVPEGDDGKFADAIRPIFHKGGFNQHQVSLLNDFWNSYMGGIKTANDQDTATQTAQKEAQATADLAQLRREMGDQYEARLELGRQVVRMNGTSTETLNKIEEAIGTAEMLRVFGNIGKKLGEAPYVEGSRPQNFGITPSEAQQQSAALLADKEFGKRLLNNPGGPEAQQLDNLQRIAAQLGRQ